jgi:hypothetical protein
MSSFKSSEEHTFSFHQFIVLASLVNSKYWKNNNKNGEKMEFIRLHSLRSWFKLPENEKKQHQIEDCDKCQSIISNAILHTRSASEGTT